jgi:serine/threonine-protein kinase
MPTKIGHFEILSELSASPACVVYKATDTQSGQTVALKAIQLGQFGEHAATLEKRLLEEVETASSLKGQNIVPIFGAGEMDGQFCASTQYIEGNSVATMLARKEGFSIWDLLDIGRQVCAGLDLAHAKKVVHYSLEPAKIMCGWDGTVRILGFGVSGAGNFTAILPDPPAFLPYMSPEQIGGEPPDERANIFSLGAIFYEMVTEQRAFNGTDAAAVHHSILEDTPVDPLKLNARMHPGLSALIMKALAKDPADRYQSGRELLEDLEQCKESKTASASAPKPAAPVVTATGTRSQTAPASSPVVASRAAATAAASPAPAPASAPAKAVAAVPVPSAPRAPQAVAPKKFAAAASASSQGAAIEFESPLSQSASSLPAARMSAASAPAQNPPPPKVAVDPMMAGNATASAAVSFSEISELPPYKEVVIAPPAPPAYEPPPLSTPERKDEKPKIQPREVAEKAIKEIKGVPPRLIGYSIAGAVALIVVIAGGIAVYVHNQNSDVDSAARPAQEQSGAAASSPSSSTPAPQIETADAVAPSVVEKAPSPARARSPHKNPAPAPVAAAPGEMALDSTPEGAQVQVDGSSNPGWATPYTLSGLKPGQHSITISKPGFVTDTRTIEVASGSKSFVTIHLAPLMAALSVSTTPAGASVLVDGKDTGKLTPAQFNLDKGQHTIVVRKPGYLDETGSLALNPGQAAAFSPTLRALGNVDDLKTVGKFKKMFGKVADPTMGTVTVRTQPKGAQVAINQHVLDKFSPVDVMLDPGNYVLDITLTGYAPIHKVITVDKGGKLAIDETLGR